MNDLISIVATPVAGETDTTPIHAEFDLHTREFTPELNPYTEFYEDDLQKVERLSVNDSCTIWNPGNDVTYQITRIS